MPFFNTNLVEIRFVKYSISDKSDINFKPEKSYYNDYFSIFNTNSLLFSYRVCLFCDLLSRLPVFCEKIKKRHQIPINFDEISPVEDENPIIGDDLDTNRGEKCHLEQSPIILRPLELEMVHKKRITNRFIQSEQKKLARITIMYTLAFFGLALTTFFIIYLA